MNRNTTSFLGNMNDSVKIYKSAPNDELISDMMRSMYGYSQNHYNASIRKIDAPETHATIGAWHVGNKFELHQDGAYGVIIAPLGEGTSSSRSIAIEGVDAKHFKEDLARVRKSATEIEQRDLRKGIATNDPEFHYRSAIDTVAGEYYSTYSLIKAQYLDSSHPKFGQEVGNAKKPNMAAPGQTQHFGGPRNGQAVHGTGTAQAMAQNTKNENNSKRQKFASFASPEELDKGEEDDAPSYSSMRRQPPSARGTDKRDDRASGNGRMRSGRHQEGAKAIAADRSIRSAQKLGKSAEKRAANRARVAAENGQTFDPSKVGPSGSFQHMGGSWDRHVAAREDDIRHARAMEQQSQQDPNLPDDRPRRSFATFVQFRGKKNPPKPLDKSIRQPDFDVSFAKSLLLHGRSMRKNATGR
ncbi:hypothetical protein EBS67_00605 [bacterium]|nr:hypothetical protein [bacterium]